MHKRPTHWFESQRIPKVVAVAIVVVVVAASCAGPTRAPVSDLDIPDPAIHYESGIYYLYATSTISSGRLPIRTSTDLRTWSAPRDSVSRVPTWASPDHWWAPALAKVGTQYWLYFAAPRADGAHHCIGRAVSDHPAGPFEPDETPVTCGANGRGAIDPEILVTAGGQRHLWFAGTSPNGIYRAPVTSEGAVGSAQRMLVARHSWEAGWLENPAPFVADGRLVMLYSAGDWRTAQYKAGIALCQPTCDTFDTPWLASGEESVDVGPGGVSTFVAADGKRWAAWHSYSVGKTGPTHPRRLHVQPLDHTKGSLVLLP